MRTKLILAASALAIGLATAGAASAQTYGRIITFGDSLSDNGNLYAATGNTSPTSPPYYQGRFSNGPVWVELLGWTQARVGGSVAGSYNSAYGGARTDNLVGFPTGMRQQITNYLGAGGTFDSDDLVTIWGGANNIFQGLPTAGAQPDPFGYIAGVSVASAADMGFMINQVSDAGAGTILVANLPNLATTPQFAGGPAQGLAAHATNAFNAALFAQVSAQAAANPNSNVIFMDVNRAFNVLLSAPGRFGFSNVTQSCLVGVTVCSSPDSYVFWDGVHPTAAGHRLVASVATDYLYYLNFGAHSAVQAEIGGRARADGMDAVLGRLGYGEHQSHGGIYIGATYDQSELDARGVIPGGDLTGSGLIVGAEGTHGGMRAGAAFQVRTADAELGLVNFTAEGASLDVYAGWRWDQFFLNAAAGYSWDQYEDIMRQTATAGVVAESSTQGTSAGAKLEAGMNFDMGGIAIIPRAGLSWVSTEVDGYVEENAFGAQHQVAARGVDSVSAEAVLRLQGGSGGMGFWAEAGYRDVLSHDGDEVTVGLAGNTAHPLHLEASDPDGGQTLLGAGLSTRFGIAEVSVGYRGRIGEAYESHQGGVEVTFSF
ncbi:SGNH/GDSL hydrolase family protein [Brevundimonas sp.]|uniref:SGNH/GDSL hydrolase family protein n=1 Tax=Brevundimonas sp. TaxID=1871086 RepID=UPI0025F9222B|nr:SGNH/GDSL hydrolase family protein [Brevundimonas sp.]